MQIIDKTSWFEQELKKLENNNDALAFKYILDFSEYVLEILDKKGIKNKNKYLAKKLDVSPAYISKLFNGRTNFTVKKLVEIAKAIDYSLEIKLRPKLSAIQLGPCTTIQIDSGNLVPVENEPQSNTGNITSGDFTIEKKIAI